VNREALELWDRALDALCASEAVLQVSADAAASRAYYAAFYAVSALFAVDGMTYRRHSAAEAAVHRDLVKPGRWSTDLGASYTRLFQLRQTGDYGGGQHVTTEDARQGLAAAREIGAAVGTCHPYRFRFPEDVE